MQYTRLYNELPPNESNNTNIPVSEKTRAENDAVDKNFIVPFHYVDGLTLKELSDYSELIIRDEHANDYIVFVMYDSLQNARTGLSYAVDIEEQAIIRYAYVIDIKKYKDNTIDEVVENHLISNIDNLSIQNQRRVLSFLREYVHDSSREVDISISEYYKRKNHEKKYKYIEFPKRLIYKNEDEK